MTTSRIQLALNVKDIDAATRFYTDLFGVGPAKQRTGYANFEVADPPLKLVLFENPGAEAPLNHLGVEVASTGEVNAAADRFRSVGLDYTMMESDRCCHAVQDKVWVEAPDVPLGGWEFYTVLADDRAHDEATESVCCSSSPAGEKAGCAVASAEGSACCSGTAGSGR
jgi:catechol 2,3-dioxygenase-like lactoylglutathione lyase family enzyme